MGLTSSKMLTAIVLIVYVLVMYSIGFLVGNGYSVDLKTPVIGKPVRLTMDSLKARYTHVAAHIWGLAYEAKAVNATASNPIVLRGYHFTIGNVECRRVAGTENTYKCSGKGYILYPIGFREEFIRRGERTRYYYAGYVDAALYSVHQAYYSALLLAPIVAGLAVYALAKLGWRSKLKLAVKAGIGVTAYVAGVIVGLLEVPDILAPYLNQPLVEAAAAGILTILGAAGIAFQAATGWRRRSIFNNI
jgi:hypothetical protein